MTLYQSLHPAILIALLVASVVFIVVSTTRWNLHPFLALIFCALGFGILSGMTLSDIVKSINAGFGGTIERIGIVIIAGTIIGNFLERSGGAFTMAERILRIVGEKSVSLAMAIIGYIVSIPVFADSGFVILIPLNKALAKRANISLAGPAMALALGLSTSHNLIPPTPGPIAAAGILNADLGLVILMGCLVGLVPLTVGYLFASRYASRIYIDPAPELSEAEIQAKMREAPPASKAFIPILAPIVLIVGKSISDFPSKPLGDGFLRDIVSFIGDPLIAMLIGVVLAFRLPKKLESKMLSTTGWVGEALITAAMIVMVTGAGGAFGRVLQNSGIAEVVKNSLASANLGIWLPFILAAAVKTAQGSSTVALVTTASLIAPLAESLGFTSEIGKALAVMAIGAGSITVSHANDSFFWILTQLCGMDVKTGYKLQTVGTLLLGLSSAVTVWILSFFLL